MKLTLAQQADHVELAVQGKRDHVERVLAPLVENGKRSAEELKMSRMHLAGLEAALATMRYLGKNEPALKKLLDKQPHPDLLAAG